MRTRYPSCGRPAAAPAVVALALVLGLLAPVARAGDLESARRQLEKVKVDLSSQSWTTINDDIKATEDFLEGLPDADAAPIRKELDGIRKQADAGIREYKTKEIVYSASRDLDRASDDVNQRPRSAMDDLGRIAEKLNSDDAKKYVDPAQLKKLQDRLASLQKMAGQKYARQQLDFVAPIVKQLDDEMAGQPFKNASTPEDVNEVTQRLNSLMSRIRGGIEPVPATDPAVKAINDKLAAYTRQIDAASGGATAKQAAQQLADRWKAQQEYFAGWDKEAQGPTWDQYTHQQSDKMGALLMPKTIEVLERLGPWFEEDSVKGPAAQYKDDPTVKATMADAHRTFDAAAAKLNTAYNNLLADAEKLPTPTDDLARLKPRDLSDNADHWFKGTPFHDANVARGKALYDKWAGAVAGASKAKEDLLNQLIAQAKAAWPKIASDLKPADGFTADKPDSFKGKLIHLTGNNRAGWDYDAEYDYAVALNGFPVAGRFDPNVKAAVDSVKKRTGESNLPDDDWDVYAVVEGPGKIRERTSESGKVSTLDGTQVGTIKAEGHKAVDCTVVRIVALHAGPVAVGPGGAVNEAGAVVATGAASSAGGAGGGSFFFRLMHHLLHLFELGLCVLAAALVVLKARPALVPQAVGAGAGGAASPLPSSVGAAVAGDNLAVGGLVFAALGVLWLLSKLIIGDLFPAVALTLCGACAASDWLRAKSVLPAGASDTLRKLALPAAGAAVLFGFLHLFLWDWYLF